MLPLLELSALAGGASCSTSVVHKILPVGQSGRAVGLAHAIGDHRLRVGAGLLFRQPAIAVRGHGCHDRIDTPGHVRAASGRVVVGRVVERLHAGENGVRGVHAVHVQLLQRATREHRAGADRVEPLLFVTSAGDVVAEDTADALVGVVAREDRHDDQPLHRAAEVGTYDAGQPIGLAFQRERPALDLLVMLELDLKQPDKVNAYPGHAGDPDTGVLVAAEDLLDIPLRNHAAGGRPPVADHHHAAVERGSDDRRAVRKLRGQVAWHGQAWRAWQKLWRGRGEQFAERGGPGAEVGRAHQPGWRVRTQRSPFLVHTGTPPTLLPPRGPRYQGYWPPFCTYERTNSSAFSSSTSSISSRIASTSSVSFSRRSLPSSVPCSGASSSSLPRRVVCRWPPVSFVAIRTSVLRLSCRA